MTGKFSIKIYYQEGFPLWICIILYEQKKNLEIYHSKLFQLQISKLQHSSLILNICLIKVHSGFLFYRIRTKIYQFVKLDLMIAI